MPISFNVSHADRMLINKIMNRVKAYTNENWPSGCISEDAELSLRMDIEACHANGNKLDLDRLLDADNFNFVHDVFGIRNHIDRTTGKLTDHFVPRFSAKHKRK